MGDDETFGALVRRLRGASGWTQWELAGRSGLEQTTISAVERDKGGRTIGTVRALARALGGDEVAFLHRAGLLDGLALDPPARPLDRLADPPLVDPDGRPIDVPAVVAYVEARPGAVFRQNLAGLKALMAEDDYVAFCLRTFKAWMSNSDLAIAAYLLGRS